MSRNGSGVYSLPAGNPVVTGTTISSTWANTTLSDIATALTGSVAADGQTAMTGNLQMGNNKVTGLAVATASGDALSYGQAATISALTVSGAFAANGGATLGDASGDALTINSSAVSAPNGLNFNSNSLVLNTSGNLGLGVTPSAWASGYKALQVGKTAVLWGGASSNDVYFGNNYYFDGSDLKYISTGFASEYFQDSGKHVWRTAPSGTAGNAITFTQAMTLDASGNLGIRATSPNAQLTLKSPSAAGTNSMFSIQAAGSTDKLLKMTVNQDLDVYSFGTDISVGKLAFETGGTERMRIDSSGNLLVGTTSNPVYGSTAARVMVSKSSGQWAIETAVPTTGADGHIAFTNSNGLVGYIETNGSSTTYATSSDYRLKENIAPMTGALAVVAQLKPVTYNWKADGSASQGFIAHELQEVVPEAVTGEKDAVYADGSIKPQGIDTSFLVATLTASIQELKAIVDAQAARITALENK